MLQETGCPEETSLALALGAGCPRARHLISEQGFFICRQGLSGTFCVAREDLLSPFLSLSCLGRGGGGEAENVPLTF